jgi:ATP-dependent DNA helicase RecG
MEESVVTLPGVGKAVASRLERIGVTTVGDLVEHFPRRYEDRTNLMKLAQFRQGETGCFEATVVRGESFRSRTGNKTISRVFVSDGTSNAVLVWFNQPYRAQTWKSGIRINVFGKANRRGPQIEFDNPDVETEPESETLHLGRIVPVYPGTHGISSKMLRRFVYEALERQEHFDENIPPDVVREFSLLPRNDAIREVHFPTDWKRLNQARRRLIFEELFLLQCALFCIRQRRGGGVSGIIHQTNGVLVESCIAQLPYQLTEDQKSVFQDISSDMESGRPMQRLLQGDVGSGKTAVAMLALLKSVENGCQGALMVPTEILAEQHYRSFSELLSKTGVDVALLTGTIRNTEKKRVLAGLAHGEIDIIIGTQALIQKDVTFHRLGLAITDEQHRFGVAQRAALQEKGEIPHFLAMSATPIPRTMALTLYGDLDISIIRQLPPGRKPVKTVVRPETGREKVYLYLAQEVRAGRQGYVVCPVIEESESLDVKSAEEIFSEIKSSWLQGISCELLHGRMRSEEKEQVMRRFVAGEIGVLVSTTVIEVGVNVPNSTMMIVEHADRFGLAQLHQLRGRVGRGTDQSYCVLVYRGTANEKPSRLKVLEDTSDGFIVAEQDLLLRGPGQFLGYRQHGLPEMKLADLSEDLSLLETARAAAAKCLTNTIDIEWLMPELKKRFDRFFGTLLAG